MIVATSRFRMANRLEQVTRWSDVSSFRTCHGSPAHHHSHEPAPQGLRLGSAFTEQRFCLQPNALALRCEPVSALSKEESPE